MGLRHLSALGGPSGSLTIGTLTVRSAELSTRRDSAEQAERSQAPGLGDEQPL